MRNTRQIIWGIVLILISSAMLFGILSLSQAEGIIRLSTATPLPSSTLTRQPSPSQGVSPTPVIYACPTREPLSCPSSVPPTSPPTPPPTWTPTWTPAWTPTRVTTLPVTWTPTQTSSPTRYLSPVPTHTRVACGAPRTWVIYVVQKGDTLYHLGQIYGIPYTVIQRANCLPNFNIHIGQLLYVPPWAPIMPSPTLFYDTYMPTEISTFYLPFETPVTETPTTGYYSPTDTPTPTDTIPTP
jgi:LysM repeat protein